MRGSLLDEVVRGSGDIDVHVISGDECRAARDASPERTRGSRRQPGEYVLAALLVARHHRRPALVRAALDPVPDLEMLYLLAVMIAALALGRGPAFVGRGA